VHLLLEMFLSPLGLFFAFSFCGGFRVFSVAKSIVPATFRIEARLCLKTKHNCCLKENTVGDANHVDSKSTSSSIFSGQLVFHCVILQLHDTSLIPKDQTANSDEITIDFILKFTDCTMLPNSSEIRSGKFTPAKCYSAVCSLRFFFAQTSFSAKSSPLANCLRRTTSCFRFCGFLLLHHRRFPLLPPILFSSDLPLRLPCGPPPFHLFLVFALHYLPSIFAFHDVSIYQI
jgi:hypothetical protein